MESCAIQQARRLADEVLFPAAVAVDEAEQVPAELFEALAVGGFYALGAPEASSDLDLPDDDARAAVVEAFAGGCLSAAFVWLQHRGALRAVAASPNEALRRSFLSPMARGQRRAGLAIGAATRTGPPMLRAELVDGEWVLTGVAPWVTGWGMVDLLLVAARDQTDQLIWALVDTDDSPSLRAEPLRLLAVQASGTVMLSVKELVVPSQRVVNTQPHAEYLARDAESLTFNGFLATGVAGRAIDMMAADGEAAAAGLAQELSRVRDRLLIAGADDAPAAPAARAAASELALRAAAALAVHTGSRSVLRTSHAARLIREATFLLTFGTRPAIRAELLTRLGAPPADGTRLQDQRRDRGAAGDQGKVGPARSPGPQGSPPSV